MDSDTLAHILEFLQGHPRTYATRSQVSMQCPYCKDSGRPVQYVPTTYTHGRLRWDSQLSHAARAHRVLPPPETVAAIHEAFLTARSTRHGPNPAVARACPRCKSAIDMTLQAGKDVMCFRCGYVHPLDASDAFMETVLRKPVTELYARPQEHLQLPSVDDAFHAYTTSRFRPSY